MGGGDDKGVLWGIGEGDWASKLQSTGVQAGIEYSHSRPWPFVVFFCWCQKFFPSLIRKSDKGDKKFGFDISILVSY
ncbi:hypothetical protein SLEP1_g40995 [Rubroshorea leprosula]|uniref:Uncharacterized protein n=1 Tax=Rubroshorea leprosula TaxID=152421 RepID=A0AAV5L5J9_9ROSI|nr:hypothetical protein SLEP1_g40995 [Rubroshorea leprosula]